VIELTLAEVAAVTGGRLIDGAPPQAVVSGPVVADSRQAGPGCLFAALAGERVDGHDYAASAAAAGAVAALVARPVDSPAVLVDDVLAGLALLAHAVVDRLTATGLRVVAVTGSSGKTGTKDLIAAVLAPEGETVAPTGSYNNELGVPLTTLRCSLRTRFLVLEMGARAPGNIRDLCAIAPPSVGVVLNVGAAHAGVFGSRQATAQTKGELVEALPADGLAVLNSDDALVAAMTARTQARVVGFGTSPPAQVRAEHVRLDEAAHASFRLITPEGAAEVSLQLHGAHHVANALAAAAVGREIGSPPEAIAARLSGATAASRWRMEVRRRADGVVVVNDAYNANPDSVRAGLQALSAMGRQGGRVAVLGEMLELGDASAAEHEAAGRLAAELGLRVIAVGEGARPVEAGALAGGAEADWVPDQDAARRLLDEGLRPGDVVLVKASRSIGLDRLAAGLLAEPGAGDSASTDARQNATCGSGRTGDGGGVGAAPVRATGGGTGERVGRGAGEREDRR
jgi:UDP-N-acetylmuramoyl-tripeptide--D-alanyl-D-alanine ligase